MKKKGFTLIELLAVIVILAIIALIATPLVLKYIEKSRKESKVDSAYSFIRNLETQMANYAIEHNGTKYTTDKENIKELGLDITVKGENPDDGKVCLSSLGQVEKAIFNFNDGKYYVSYDGKKGSISDKDTYDNFKCDNNNVIFDGEVKLTYNGGGYSLDQCFDYTKFKHNSNYRITIDNVNGIEKKYDAIGTFGKIVTEMDSDYNEILADAVMLGNKNEFNYAQLKESDICLIFTYDESADLTGNHHVKIEYIGENKDNHVLRVESSYLYIFSTEMVEGDAVVEIKDRSGNVKVLNVMVKNDSALRKIRIYDSTIIDPYYESLKNGDIITVTVTQGDKKYVLGGSKFNYCEKDPCFSRSYYWGNDKLGYWVGC